VNKSVIELSGHVHARRPRHCRSRLTTSQRALLAADLVASGVPLTEAAALMHCATGYVWTAGKVSDFDRVRIANGEITLSQFHNRARRPSEGELYKIEEDRLFTELHSLLIEGRRNSAECVRVKHELMRKLNRVAEPAPVIQAAE
jgi:hypothetical protein